MNLLHLKTNTIADFTGTVTVYNQTGGTNTVAASDLVRPSDWNSVHKMLLTFGGNTTGNSTLSGTNIHIAGAGGVSVGGSNGSFVISGLSDPGFLTTAALSNHSHGNPTLALTNLAGTTASNSGGLTLSLSAQAQSVQPVAASAANGSYLFSTLAFVNTNGVSWSTSTDGIRATVKTDYLTTARASNDAVGLNTAQTNVTWTVNSSGLSINAAGYAGTGTTFNGTNISGSLTQNSNGIRVDLSVGAGGAADGYNSVQFTNSTANSTMALLWAGNSNGSGNITLGLTGSTVTGSAPSGAGGGAAISAGANSQNTGTVIFSNSNGLTFGLNAGTLTASHNGLTQQSTQPVAASAANGSYLFSTLAFVNTNGVSWSTSTDGIRATVKTDYLTTARASNDAVGLNTAATQVTWTVNSGGISLNAGAYLTTAAQSNHSHGNPTLALTNVSGTTASNSAGLTLSLSVAAPGAAAENNWFNMGGNTAGNSTASGSTILLSAGNNVTLSGTNGSVIRIDAGGGGGGVTLDRGWSPFDMGHEMLLQADNNASIMCQPYEVEAYVSFNRVVFPVYFSAATNSTGTYTLSQSVGFYTWVNSTQLSLYGAFGGTITFNHSGTQNSASNVGGIRTWEGTFGGTSITPGNYVVAMWRRSSSSSANATISAVAVSQINTNFSGGLMLANNATYQMQPGRGVYTTSSSSLPDTIGLSQLQGTLASLAFRASIFSLGRSD